MKLFLDAHPLLEASGFVTQFPGPLSEHPTPSAVMEYLSLQCAVPLSPSDPVQPTGTKGGDTIKGIVRNLLRHGGFKPTGRSKPACEYLIKAIEQGWLNPNNGINVVVDVCNVISLHSGLPISVIDLAKAKPPFSLRICPPDTQYVFNPSGQVIDIGGLISLWDADGPCAGPVKDSQRTKTDDATTTTLSIVWGTKDLPGRTDKATEWYRSLLASAGATTEPVELSPVSGQ